MVNVSIIVPVYNAESVIDRCINSILNQEYKDFELILVDDGSKDDSGKIIDYYAAIDERIVPIHKENGGVSNTRNVALDRARGKYIQFLDADDWMSDNSTKLLVRTMEKNDVDLVIGDFYRVVGKNIAHKGSLGTDEVLALDEFAELMMESPADFYYGVLWNKLYKKEIIDKYHIRMDESLSFCEDFIFNLEYYLHMEKLCALQVPIYYYVKTEGSLVSQAMSISKIIEMKTNVFTYYNNFYKNVLDEKQYRKDRIAIASFFIDTANDSFVMPMGPMTKKLGKENVKAELIVDDRNIEVLGYYLSKLNDKYLNSIAIKNGLDLNSVKLLSAIYISKEYLSLKVLCDYTNLSNASASMCISKLAVKQLVGMHYRNNKVVVGFGSKADSIVEDIRMAYSDVKETLLSDFNEEEKNQLCTLLEKMNKNLVKILN